MTLEEKIKTLKAEYLRWLTLPRYQAESSNEYYADIQAITEDMETLLSICKQEIEAACKKQREICADTFMAKDDYAYIKLHTGNTISTLKRDEILNAPSPKEKL